MQFAHHCKRGFPAGTEAANLDLATFVLALPTATKAFQNHSSVRTSDVPVHSVRTAIQILHRLASISRQKNVTWRLRSTSHTVEITAVAADPAGKIRRGYGRHCRRP